MNSISQKIYEGEPKEPKSIQIEFSKEEIELAVNKNIKPITLGKTRLRTETAAFTSVLINNII